MTSWLDKPGVKERLERKLEARKRQRELNRFDPRQIFDKIRKGVIGQDVIAARIAWKIFERSSARRKGKPLVTLLISGPTGTGKTELAKSLAAAAYGDPDKFLCRIDCGNLGTSEHKLDLIQGGMTGYQGSRAGLIPEFLARTNGEGVILFDEVEKAVPTPSAPLAKVLLSLLDEGRIQSPFDRKDHDATNCIIVLTSNAAQRQLGEIAAQYLQDVPEVAAEFDKLPDLRDMDEAAKRILAETFAPEFLGRLDFVSTVAPLTSMNRAYLVQHLFMRLSEEYEVEITDFTEAFDDFLVEGVDRFGQGNVRGAKRWIEDTTARSLADARRQGWRRVVADWDGEQAILQPDDA